MKISLNIHEAKTHLSRYLNELSGDDRIVLCNRNRPVAEIRLLPENNSSRILDVAAGEFIVPESFFEPLDDELLDTFEGNS